MSDKIRPAQYADQKGSIQEGFDRSILNAEGAVVPVDATAGYAPGCLFWKRAGTLGASLYINEGTNLSSLFKPISATDVIPGATRVARGQATTASASDTIVTGLTTVVSAIACMDDAPVTGATFASASIGNQSGAPAAGSILVQTWKPTTAGAAGNPDAIAATTFAKKVNWIAIGT